jgi:hypothetical protein
MNDRSLPAKPPTTEARDRATAELCDHFAAGHIELEALESRLAAVDEAKSEAELAELVRDLPALTTAGAVVPEASAAAPAVAPPAKRGWALAVLGGASRKGEWSPPRRLNAVAVMGGIELDFRDAHLAPGETHVTIVALMGGVEVIVPPGLAVTVRGLGLLGAVDQEEQTGGEADPNAPQLKVTALACMGGVEVKTRASKKAR